MIFSTIVSTVIASLIGVVLPILIKEHTKKLERRIKPIISCQHNSTDDVINHLNSSTAQWFGKVDEVKKYLNNEFCNDYHFFIVRLDEKYKMLNTSIDIYSHDDCDTVTSSSGNPSRQTWQVGTITNNRKYIFPFRINGEKQVFEMRINYTTEQNEVLTYYLTGSLLKNNDVISDRKDKLYLMLGKHNKQKRFNKEPSPFNEKNKLIGDFNLSGFPRYSSDAVKRFLQNDNN